MSEHYGKSDYIFGNYALFSIGISFNIMGVNRMIMAKKRVEIYWYFNFRKY